MFSINIVLFSLVLLSNRMTGLLELKQVHDNGILTTEVPLRNTLNTLFDFLKGVNDSPRWKELNSTIHNHLITLTLQDYNNLKEIEKITRVDNKSAKNETVSFMTAINDLINEDINVRKQKLADIDDSIVVEHVEQFLARLESLKEDFGISNKTFDINEKLYKILQNDGDASLNSTMDVKVSGFDNATLHHESQFWKPDLNTRRIYKGERTKIKRFPFMASIQIFNKFHCGGCIISDDLIITASSCLQLAWNNRFFRENPSFLSVRVGSSFYRNGGENIPVLEIYFHPNYNPKTLWNNLCILRLVRKLRFSKKKKRIKKIDFDRKDSALPMTTDGITIIGWGARGSSNVLKNPWENILAYADLDIYPLRECQEIYSKEYVTKKHFCAGFFSKGGGACNHDVGGPGIVNGILTGIVSFGSPLCGTPDAPTVFTKIGYYTDWIEDIMEQDVPSYQIRTTPRISFDLYSNNYQKPTPTVFNVEPINGEIESNPIIDVDALRTLANAQIFQEFLKTMVNVDNGDYEGILEKIKLIERESGVSTDAPVSSHFARVPDQPVTDHYEVKGTQMGAVDYQERNEYDDEPTTMLPYTIAPVMNKDTEYAEISKIDEHLEQLVKIDKQIDEIVKMDKNSIKSKVTKNKATKNNKEVIRIDDNKDLEKDLVDMISEMDLKKLIDNSLSNKDVKKPLDEKMVQVFSKKEKEEKYNNDDSVFTFLYMSDNDNTVLKKKPDKFGLIKDYVESDDDEDESNAAQDGPGMSIDFKAFKKLPKIS